MENGKFESDEKYKNMKDGIKEFNIDYNTLSMLNELTLKILGIDDANDRKLILNEIKKINGAADKLRQHGLYILFIYLHIAIHICCTYFV